MELLSFIQSFADWTALRGDHAGLLIWASLALITVAFDRRISMLLMIVAYFGLGRLALDTLPAHWAITKLLLGLGVTFIGSLTISPYAKFQSGMHFVKRIVFALGLSMIIWVLDYFEIWSVANLPEGWNLALLSCLGLGIWLFLFLSEPLHRLLGLLMLVLGIDLLLSFSIASSGILFVSAVLQLTMILFFPTIYKYLLRTPRPAFA